MKATRTTLLLNRAHSKIATEQYSAEVDRPPVSSLLAKPSGTFPLDEICAQSDALFRELHRLADALTRMPCAPELRTSSIFGSAGIGMAKSKNDAPRSAWTTEESV